MNIQSVNDKAFEVYGRVVDGYDYAELLATLEKCSEKPADSVIYVPGCAELETCLQGSSDQLLWWYADPDRLLQWNKYQVKLF